MTEYLDFVVLNKLENTTKEQVDLQLGQGILFATKIRGRAIQRVVNLKLHRREAEQNHTKENHKIHMGFAVIIWKVNDLNEVIAIELNQE